MITTIIVILNTPLAAWKGKTTNRFINADIDGLDVKSTAIRIKETSQAPAYVIPKIYVEAISIIFGRDKT